MGLGNGIKKAIGIEGSAKDTLLPMLGYQSASIMLGGAGYIVLLYFMTYLTEVEGLSAAQAGLAHLIPIIWDAITDPVMGIITDRTRSRMGKHRPWFLVGALPVAVFYFLMWYSCGISGQGNSSATMWYYICTYALYKTAYTITAIPHAAMLPGIAPGYFERTQYNSVGYIMNSVGQISSFLLVSVTLGFMNMDMPGPELRGKYAVLGLILGIWFGLPWLLAFFGTKEPSSLGMPAQPNDLRSNLKEIAQVFRSRAFRRYFFLTLCYNIAVGLRYNSNQYFVLYIAKRWNRYNLLTTVSGIAEASGFPLNFWLVKRFGKQSCGKLLTPVMVAGILLNLFITSNTSPGMVTVLLFVSAVLYNLGCSGPGFVATNIHADVTDVDEMITGRKREGVVSIFNSVFMRKTINGFMAGFVGFVLQAFGFVTGTAKEGIPQTAAAVFGLRFVFIILPAVFAALCFFGIRQYKMTKEDHETLKKAIDEKHETGRAELTPEQAARIEALAGLPMEEMWVGRPM